MAAAWRLRVETVQIQVQARHQGILQEGSRRFEAFRGSAVN